MILSDLLTNLIDITKRPDRLALLNRAINRACIRLSQQQFFVHDYKELLWEIDPAGATAFNIPRTATGDFRKIEYIKREHSIRFLTQVAPREVFCKGSQRTEVYYITATDIIVNLAGNDVAEQKLKIGLYGYPSILTLNTDVNWCTALYPYVILDGAAAAVFNAIGDDASYRYHEEEFRLGCISVSSDLMYSEAQELTKKG